MTHSGELVEQMRRYGSKSLEYRRAYRRMYRATNQRIDYTPDRKAIAALETAIENGLAVSYTDAINQALRDWVSD